MVIYIPKDLDDDFTDNESSEKNDNENVLTDDETVNNTNGKGILNYEIDDLLNIYINDNW